MKTLGKHIILELSDCAEHLLNNVPFIKDMLIDATIKSGAHIMDIFDHKFSPTGISMVVILSESHLSIHTWPESNYAAIDIYTCGNCDPIKSCEYIINKLGSKNYHMTEIDRGIKYNNSFKHEIKNQLIAY